ncbi:MAG: hypothetical protein EXS22_06785 [Pedosphaera sp.]|nr:hypothetical protein [Pedosphaera sp.]MSU43729.1 hypothetical protein [Pedosphaera sp.]
MNPLTDLIRDEIVARGPISFARFMERALYEPGCGYYEIVRPVGRRGDFYTSVSVGPTFGELLGFQFAQWANGDALHLMEAGAHDGRLMADILQCLQNHWPELWPKLECTIVEPSPARRQVQAQTLAAFAGKIRWVSGLEEIPEGSIRGVIYSNELLDAMPVHRLGWDAATQAWFEWGVAWEAGRFAWRRLAVAELKAVRNETLQVSQAMREVLPDGFVTVACPRAADWWHAAARRLGRGTLLTLDYGLTSEEFFAPHRTSGTVRAYFQHQIADDVLGNVGEQDLTASVNFSVTQMMGELAGLATRALQTQEQFLMGVFQQTLARPDKFPEWTPERRRQFQTLAHPQHLGRSHHALVQSR